MSSQFNLRPVSHSPSISSPSPTTPLNKSSSFNLHSMSRTRRPLSPTSLRDVDLTHDTDMASRKYPAPPTGHDLMAFFPPPPPEIFPEMRPGPTSGFFQRQERAFFAQAGKEIVRVRVEVDLPQQPDPDHNIDHHHHYHHTHHHPDSSSTTAGAGKSRTRDPGPSRPWSNSTQPPPPPPPGPQQPIPPRHQQHPQHTASPPQSSVVHPPSVPFPLVIQPQPHGQPLVIYGVHPQPPPPSSTSSQPLPPPPPPSSQNIHAISMATATATGLAAVAAVAATAHPHHPTIGLHTPPQDGSNPTAPSGGGAKTEFPEDDDESWRRPMPYNERRRAGKHTRRVIIRN